jgi:hypothetical protein
MASQLIGLNAQHAARSENPTGPGSLLWMK